MMIEQSETGTLLRIRLVGELRAAITSGKLPSGARVNEREVCDEYSVSRTVVREALRQLESEGFIAMKPHKGAIVTEMSYVRAINLYDLREALESLACKLCALRATVELKRALATAVDKIEQATETEDLESLLSCKNQFYDILLEGSGNPELSGMLRLLHARISLLRRYSLSAEGRLPQSVTEIRAILAAIIAGDPLAAQNAGAHHIAQARATALPLVFKQEFLSESGSSVSNP